ncbi:hypothetical protein [Thermococcus sp.]|uniref:hypothetical protein n=1 Tax=Thermococcus sp. TaxID=35749 RepID=UPI002608A664|nr:hypothetical protein [Thermococcus sp.]
MARLKLAAGVLLFQAAVNSYQSMKSPWVYLPFVALDLILALGVWKENRPAIKVALVYLGIDLFLAIFYLMAGVYLQGITAILDFLGVHNLIGYIMEQVREEGEEGS